MIIDGKALAEEIREELREAYTTLERPARVRVFAFAEDEITKQYIGIKERVGAKLGVEVVLTRLSESTTTEDLVLAIKESDADGIVVQLPLPRHIDLEAVRDAIPFSRDIDCIGMDAYAMFQAGTSPILPPVISACEEILLRGGIDVLGKSVVIVGYGRLVGQPATVWFKRRGAEVVIADKDTKDVGILTRDADIIVLGAGVPNLLTPDMIKEGVVILDAGASEAGGKVVGDADPACAEKASLFTPVPGGIGPVAIAMLFRNLYILATDIGDSH